MTLRDALYFMLLTSSNQAANAIAEHVGGSQEEFIAMMNQRAEELGCVDSHFVNPSGLYDEEQMTTVYDMALIGIAAYSNPVMLEISQTKNCRMPATANNPEGFSIYQEHRMLDPSREEYYVYGIYRTFRADAYHLCGQREPASCRRDDEEHAVYTL